MALFQFQFPIGRSPFVNAWDFTPLELFDQDFGQPSVLRLQPYWNQPSRTSALAGAPDKGTSKVINDKDKFAVNLDVKHFKPEELKVRAEGRMVEIEGDHEEQADEHGFISRHFVRKYQLPEDVDVAKLTSNLSPQGVLTIHAPKLALEGSDGSRAVPIQFGAAPHAIQNGNGPKKD